ncbi:MAG: outer membrane beta-barrel protein [Ignavibacteria bacterium]|nr:outer membrane beta-barrel protein [Ignavibacteria bacterium]
MKKILLFLILTIITVSSYSQIPLKLGFYFGGAFPVGTFSNVYKAGVSIEGIALYNSPFKGLDFSLSVGYNEFKYKYEYFTNEVLKKLDVWVANPNPEWNASSIPIMIGVRYNFDLKEFYPYFSAELGVNLMNFNSRFAAKKIVGPDTSNITTFSFGNAIESKTETGFGFGIGTGFDIPVAEKASVNLGIKYIFGAVVYSNAYNVYRNNNSQYTAEELKNTGIISGKIGIILKF